VKVEALPALPRFRLSGIGTDGLVDIEDMNSGVLGE
jgi:hypothetical protein